MMIIMMMLMMMMMMERKLSIISVLVGGLEGGGKG